MTGEATDAALTRQKELGYWEARRTMLYYQAVFQYSAVAGYNAQSVIDVGSGGTDYINWLYWIPERSMLDFSIPNPPEGVSIIETDFMTFEPERKFDLVLCCQVLEHLKEPKEFCDRLKTLGENLIVTVPYKWQGHAPGHINDPVDETKLHSWMGLRPNNQQVVYEPFREGRLIAYYNMTDGPDFRFDKAFVLSALAERTARP